MGGIRQIVSLVVGLLFFTACTKEINNTREIAPADKPPVATPAAPVTASPTGSITISKEFLDHDLILGGYISNFEVDSDLGNLPGLHFTGLSTRLIRIKQKKTASGETLEFTRSQQRPWEGSATGTSHSTFLGKVSVRKITDTHVSVDAGDLGTAIAEMFKIEGIIAKDNVVRASDQVKTFADGFGIDIEEKILVPVQKQESQLSVAVTLNFNIFFKKWVRNEKFQEQTISKNYGYFTLNDMFRRSEDTYKREAQKNPQAKILKWDLNKVLVFSMEKNTPERFKPIIKSAVETWNQVLRAEAGLEKDFIRVEESQETLEQVGNPSKNIIYWENDMSKGASLARATWSNDPLTGEIFNAHVYVGGTRLVRKLEEIYAFHGNVRTSSSPLAPVAQALQGLIPSEALKQLWNIEAPSQTPLSLSFAGNTLKNFVEDDFLTYTPPLALRDERAVLSREEYIDQSIHNILMHEVGHILGLRHNFKGSLSYQKGKTPSTSIMDYASNWTYLRGEQLKTPGAYDRQAIAYGYANKKISEKEALPFCTDDEINLKFGTSYKTEYDPSCAKDDEGARPLVEYYLPYLNKLYQAIDLEQNSYYRDELFVKFADLFTLQATLQTASLKVPQEDKDRMCEAVAEILALPVGQSAETVDIRLSTALVYLYRSTPMSLDTGRTLCASFLTKVRELILGSEQSHVASSLKARIKLLDIFVSATKRTPNKDNRRMALATLADLRSQLSQKKKSSDVTIREEAKVLSDLLEKKFLVDNIKD
ncbi:MAG: zinc-dependent metalloprotease [Bdellovibrionales bacterium]